MTGASSVPVRENMMYKTKRILGLICARGGSSGVPGKNILDFFGTPMLALAIGKLRSLEEVDRVIVDTDSREIAEVAVEHGAEVPFLRPGELARGDTPMLPVLRHCLARLRPDVFDVLILAQANSPLSKAEDMRTGLHKLVDEDLDVVFSVAQCGHPPQWTLSLEGECPHYAFPGHARARPSCRQENEPLYRTTGAFSCARVEHVLHGDPVQLCLPAQGQRSAVVVTETASAVDIDTPEDLIVAKAFYAARQE